VAGRDPNLKLTGASEVCSGGLRGAVTRADTFSTAHQQRHDRRHRQAPTAALWMSQRRNSRSLHWEIDRAAVDVALGALLKECRPLLLLFARGTIPRALVSSAERTGRESTAAKAGRARGVSARRCASPPTRARTMPAGSRRQRSPRMRRWPSGSPGPGRPGRAHSLLQDHQRRRIPAGGLARRRYGWRSESAKIPLGAGLGSRWPGARNGRTGPLRSSEASPAPARLESLDHDRDREARVTRRP
jgi:hypothetical protein